MVAHSVWVLWSWAWANLSPIDGWDSLAHIPHPLCLLLDELDDESHRQTYFLMLNQPHGPTTKTVNAGTGLRGIRYFCNLPSLIALG